MQNVLGMHSLQEAVEEFIVQCEHMPNQETIKAMREADSPDSDYMRTDSYKAFLQKALDDA
ncbi:hypothetical protein NHP21005_09880 [Helicobacter sp. NHP21005]|nr:hypothetical protein NHP21005_09880 [Helicobacter sp. NHP21005]